MRGVIGRFNKLRRKISSGVLKTADKLVSSIRFWNTHKGDLPHYLFMFWKLDTLGKELINTVCSRLLTMLNLDIQKWKDAMKALADQQDIGGMDVSMESILKSNKDFGQLSSNNTFFADIWFRGLKTA